MEKTNTQWLRFYGNNNTRDLAGLRSKDGRVIPAGRLIRSGAITHINSRSARILKDKYGVQCLIDLRTDGEGKRCPPPEIEGIKTLHIPVLQNAMLGITEDENSTAEKIKEIMNAGLSEKEFMARVYVDIITDKHAITAFRFLFGELLARESGATIYFCSH